MPGPIYVFEELDEAQLERPPLAVLRAFRYLGVRLPPAGWAAMPLNARVAFLHAGARDKIDIAELRELLRYAPGRQTTLVVPMQDPPADSVPENLLRAVMPARSIPVDFWRALRPLDRHVLEMLTARSSTGPPPTRRSPSRRSSQEAAREPRASLAFTHRHYQSVVSGEKRQTTRRRADPRIETGTMVRADVIQFADLEITDVIRKRLSDFTEDDAQAEGGYTLEEFREPLAVGATAAGTPTSWSRSSASRSPASSNHCRA